MGEGTKIEWAHHTFNPWSGCEKVSAGCANCYAAALPPGMRRGAEWGKDRPRVLASDAYWRQPVAWDRAAAKAGQRHRVFCASTADVFEAREDLDPWRDLLMALIALTPNLDWLLLTKRPEYAGSYLAAPGLYHRILHAAPFFRLGALRRDGIARSNDRSLIGISDPTDLAVWWPNLWIGTSVEDQATADERIPHLLRIPARVRFLSIEPLLGPVEGIGRYLSESSLGRVHCILCQGTGLKNRVPGQLGSGQPGDPPCPDCHEGTVGGVGWVIAGGESGRRARPMHPDWVRSLRGQCLAAGVPFFFKQWGEWAPFMNEEHFTHGGEEKHPHLWIDRETGESGYAWIVDDDGTWSNWTGDVPMVDGNVPPSVAILGRHGKAATGRTLDGRTWDEFPKEAA